MERSTLNEELGLARELARSAGRAVMELYGSVEHDPDDRSPVTAADRASNRVIVEGLRDAFPDDSILSEESRDSRERLEADRVWIVDPLDGTKEFLAQNGEFSIMIGLAVAGEPALGVVYQPDGDALYGAVRGGGAWVERAGGDRRRLERGPPAERAWRLVGSRSHPDPLLERMRNALPVDTTRPSGSVGVKCALIAEGECDVYIHPVPYLKEWDTCAPEIILREAGGDVTDCEGNGLRYNKAEPRQPHGIVACAPGLSIEVLKRIGPIYAEREAPAGR